MINYMYLIVLSAIIGAPIPFMKKDLLQDFSSFEQIIYTNILLLSVFIPLYYIYEKRSFQQFIDKSNSKSFNKLLLYSFIVGSGLIISGIILQNYDSVIRFKSYQRSLSVILLTIVGCCIYEEKFTMNMFLGILLILFGMYLLDK